MKVLFLAAESVPFVKVGGLGDVAGALPEALRRRGFDVRLVIPRYGTIDPLRWNLGQLRDNFPVGLDWRTEACQLWATADQQTWFIENQYFFGSRTTIYGHGDDEVRFALFCHAALEACRQMNWWPDVIHAHDWHAAAAIRIAWGNAARPALVFTIHNLAHQGRFANDAWPLVGVYDAFGELNLMEQALYTSDVITTVSPTYADEIKRPEYGFGLDHMLRERSDRLVGILNGIDPRHFDPATDQHIAQQFSVDDLAGKAVCKAALQREVGLPERADVPLVAVVSRLDSQKGIDLIVQGLGRIIAETDAQLMVLGSGYGPYEDAFRDASRFVPERVANYIGFNAPLAQRVYAGADIFLMPSAFEPCGLSQMISMRYGTIPVVRATGGLVDTVPDMSQPEGVGVVFTDYNVDAMLHGLGRALAAYRYPNDWSYFVRRAMTHDFSWDTAATRYEDVYRWALSLR